MSEISQTSLRESELKNKKICRFCLTQVGKLTNIYYRDSQAHSAPLPVQVMACVSIEAFSNDGMPSYICSGCRLLFQHCYRFKQMCKKADTMLRQFPLTGQWPEALGRPKIPDELLPKYKSLESPRKYEKKPETSFFDSIEKEENVSEEEVQELMDIVSKTEEETTARAVSPTPPPQPSTSKKPKLLNKSSIRILNKEAQIPFEPRLSTPQVKRDEDGNMALVTEILDPSIPYEEPDPIKTAIPVETNVFPCPHCERSFPLRQLRDIHMVNHNRERSFKCSECEKCFFSKYDLQKHVLIHTEDKPYKCVICEKAFTRATLLHRHEKVHTDIPKFICVYCEKPFLSKEEMERHTERHRKVRPFSCKICKKSFAFKQGLERHEVIHSRVQPFPCQYCEQSFSTPSKLARHLTAHAGSRPYPCKFCSNSYLLSHHLTRHLRSHKNGLGSFMCIDCGKSFQLREDLVYHSAVHATETLVCPLCKESFDDIEAVTNHIKQHAEGDTYACEFCDLIFMTAERLEQHTNADHTVEMAAYREDDQANADRMASAYTNDAKEVDEAIEEFLIEELNDDPLSIKEETEWADEESKEEDSEKGKQQKKQKLLNKTTKTSNDLNGKDEEFDIIIANEPGEESSPAKLRKIAASGSVAKRNVEDNTRKSIKIEATEFISSLASQKPKEPTISSVLQSLPKSLMVKRSGPAPKSAQTETPKESTNPIEKAKLVQTEKKSPQKEVISPTRPTGQRTTRATRNSAENKGTLETLKIQPLQEISKKKSGSESIVTTKKSPQVKQQSLTGKRTYSGASQSSSAAGTAASVSKSSTPPKGGVAIEKSGEDKKIVEMMLGDRRVKVQKITMTKAQAAAMAKDGRIHVKDGAMILKQQATKSKK